MEFGPRALGARSILGDPRNPQMQAQMNIKIKFREFRPFAPSVLRERVTDYFELDVDSPYMLLVAPVRNERRSADDRGGRGLWGIDKLNVPRSDIPAVTHIDYSARVQTVSAGGQPGLLRSHRGVREPPVARCSSTRPSTSAASRSSARRRTPTAASCAPTSTLWCSARSAGQGGAARMEEDRDWRKEFQLD